MDDVLLLLSDKHDTSFVAALEVIKSEVAWLRIGLQKNF